MLRPEEIMIPDFTRGFKGYNQQEVDNCINTLIMHYRELYFKYAETEEKLAAIAEKYKETSTRAGEAMNSIKQMSEAIIADANDEANRIVSEAQQKAELITGTMKESCGNVLSSYVDAFEEEKRKFIEFEQKSAEFRETILDAYKQYFSEIREKFPAITSDDIKDIKFEAKAAEVFKDSLQAVREQQED